MYLPYVYRVTNKTTNQYYIGFRKANTTDPVSDLWCKYFTSSRFVKSLIKCHGVSDFTTEILFSFGDWKVCYWFEQVMIKRHINDPLCLNKSFIDPDSDRQIWSTSDTSPTSETLEKRSRSLRGKIPWNKGVPQTDEYKYKIRVGYNARVESGIPFKKRGPHTEEHKKQVSDKLKGRPSWNTGKTKETDERLQKMSDRMSNGGHPMAGMKMSEEYKQKRRHPKPRATCPHCGKEGGSNLMKRYHFDNCPSK